MSGAPKEAALDVAQAPKWAWVLSVFIVASVLFLSGVAAYMVAWELDRAELEEHRALFVAGALAEVASAGGDDAAQKVIETFSEARPDMVEAFVITPGTIDTYGINRGHSYGANLDAAQRGKRLAPLATADPRDQPQAPRHKARIDRFSRVIAGLSITPKPERALPTLTLSRDTLSSPEGEVEAYAAQVPIRRTDPGSAGASFRSTVPTQGVDLFGLISLILLTFFVGLLLVGITQESVLSMVCFVVVPIWDAKEEKSARPLLEWFRPSFWLFILRKHNAAWAPSTPRFVVALIVMTILCGVGLSSQYESSLQGHVEAQHEDARVLLGAAQESGLSPAASTALVISSDRDFTGAAGFLYAGEAPKPRGQEMIQAGSYDADQWTLHRALTWFSLALLCLILGLCHRFIVRALVACRANPYAYGYVMPSLVGMGVLVFIPFLTGVGLSVFAYDAPRYYYTGLGNFTEILFGSRTGDVSFYWTLFSTLLWTVSNVFLHAVIGLGLAMLLKDPALRFKKYYRVLLIIPWAIPNYITALIWKGMFNKEFGAINRFLEAFQVALGMDPSGVDWLGGSFATAFTANLVTNTWLGFPFMMVVSLGALQSIPGALYEAADVDGASPWQKFRHITLPLLKPALFPAIILGSIWTFNMFNVIYLVSGGGPDHSTEILITDAYRAFAELNRYGLAAAYSVIIFVILFAYTVMTNRITKATEGAFE